MSLISRESNLRFERISISRGFLWKSFSSFPFWIRHDCRRELVPGYPKLEVLDRTHCLILSDTLLWNTIKKSEIQQDYTLHSTNTRPCRSWEGVSHYQRAPLDICVCHQYSHHLVLDGYRFELSRLENEVYDVGGVLHGCRGAQQGTDHSPKRRLYSGRE